MKKKINQKKLRISKKNKKSLITLIIILLLANLGLIMNEVMKKEITEATQISSSFSNAPGISYKVFLKQNGLYNSVVQPEDVGNFSALIDHIGVTFNNKYQGGKGAEYKGDYSITGELTGWESGTESPAPAWTKEFILSPKKNFRTKDDGLMLTQNVNIDYNHFNAFVAEVGKVTGYNTTYSMKVVMAVNYTITTDEGEATGSVSPSLTIPLGENYFKIAKSGIDEVKNDITKTVKVAAPVDYGKVILFSTIGLFCLILLILILSSAETTLTDIQRKRVRKLLKAYGSRAAAIDKGLDSDNLDLCYVHSMNDLVKISDEIERPIFYVYHEDLAAVREFFIVDNEKTYIYRTMDFNKPDEAEESAEKNKEDARLSLQM